MPKAILNSPRIMARVGKGVAARVTQQVGMDGEGQAGALTDALYTPIHGDRRNTGTDISALDGSSCGKCRQPSAPCPSCMLIICLRAALSFAQVGK